MQITSRHSEYIVDILRQDVRNHHFDHSHHPKSNKYIEYKTMFVLDNSQQNNSSWILRDQQIDQVGPNLISRQHNFRVEVSGVLSMATYSVVGINHDTTTTSSTSQVAPHAKQGTSYEELCGYWPFSENVHPCTMVKYPLTYGNIMNE